MRVRPTALKPQRSRSSCCLAKTRVGSLASVHSSANSLHDSSTRVSPTTTRRSASLICSARTRRTGRVPRAMSARRSSARQAGAQLGVAERLGEVVVGAGLEGAQDVELAVLGAEQHERQAVVDVAALAAAHGARERAPAAGVDVDDRGVGHGARAERERLVAGRRSDAPRSRRRVRLSARNVRVLSSSSTSTIVWVRSDMVCPFGDGLVAERSGTRPARGAGAVERAAGIGAPDGAGADVRAPARPARAARSRGRAQRIGGGGRGVLLGIQPRLPRCDDGLVINAALRSAPPLPLPAAVVASCLDLDELLDARFDNAWTNSLARA